jgi:hypothetical protein
LRIDNLGCGTLFPPLASGFHRCRWIIQRPYSKLHETIPGMSIFIPGKRPFLIAIIPESLSTTSRFRYRHHPGIVIAFIPERPSPCPGLRKRFGTFFINSFPFSNPPARQAGSLFVR